MKGVDRQLWKMMTPEEKRRWRRLVATIEDHFWDTLPKQQQVLDYLRSREELVQLQRGYQLALDNVHVEDNGLADLNTWSALVTRCETKISRLQNLIGFNAKYESQLRKAKAVRSDPKALPEHNEPSPWDDPE